MLDRFTFKQKIASIVMFAIVALVCMSVYAVLHVRMLLTEGRKSELVTAVQSAYNIAAAYKDKADKGEIPVADAQKAAAAAIGVARYGGKEGKTEYFYIWGLDGTGVMHPIKPEWAGQNMMGKIKDGNGVDIIKALVDGMRASPTGHALCRPTFPVLARPSLCPSCNT